MENGCREKMNFGIRLFFVLFLFLHAFIPFSLFFSHRGFNVILLIATRKKNCLQTILPKNLNGKKFDRMQSFVLLIFHQYIIELTQNITIEHCFLTIPNHQQHKTASIEIFFLIFFSFSHFVRLCLFHFITKYMGFMLRYIE